MKKLLISILIFISCLSGSAQFTLVSHTAAVSTTNNTTPVTTPAISTIGANLCIVSYTTVPWDIGTVTDSSGNIYSTAKSIAGRYTYSAILYSFITTTSTSVSFTATGGPPNLSVECWAGGANIDTAAQSSNQNNITDSPLAVGSLTPTNPNELVVTGFMTCQRSLTPVPSVSSPFTTTDIPIITATPSTGEGAFIAYQVQGGTATTVNPIWTFDGNGGSECVAMTAAAFYSRLSPPTLSITTTGVPEGFTGTAYSSAGSIYSNQLTNVGGIGPFTWSITSGTLPTGLSMSSSGLITGTPTTAISATSITFTVTDSRPVSTSIVLPMTITSSGSPLTANAGTCTGSLLNMTQTVAYAGCALSASGGTPPYTFTPSSISTSYGVPEGLTLSSSGVFSSTVVNTEGIYSSIFNATDSLGTFVTVPVTFSIAGNNATSCLPWEGSIFNRNISTLPVDTSAAAPVSSALLYTTIKAGGSIPYMTVPNNQPYISTNVTEGCNYWTPQGVGPMTPLTPIPLDAPQEGPAATYGDHHVLVFKQGTSGARCTLWEGYTAGANIGGTTQGVWNFAGTDYFDMQSYAMLNFEGTTQDNCGVQSSGTPMAPMLIAYEEVVSGGQKHPTALTLSQVLNYYVWPATTHGGGLGGCSGGYEDGNHLIVQSASTGGATGPPTYCSGTMPFGEIYRLKASVPNPCPYSTNPQAHNIIQGFYGYGIMPTDNGISGFVELTPDSRWNTSDLSCLNNLILSNFEPVNVSSIIKTLDTSGLPTVSYEVIQPVVTSITVSPSTSTILTVTGTQQFTATCNWDSSPPTICTTMVNWTSSNTSVATIGSTTGLATGNSSVGTTTITATSGSISGITTLGTYVVPTYYQSGSFCTNCTIK